MTTFEEFRNAARAGNVIPAYDTIVADTETAVGIYAKIRRESPFSFLLESVEGGEKIARYSFIGFDPFMTISIRGSHFSIQSFHKDVEVLPKLAGADDHPLEALKKMFAHFKTVRVQGLPRFTGGAVGYFGYETVRLLEDIPVPEADELSIPDGLLMFCDTLLIFDNVTHRLFLVSNGYIGGKNGSDEDVKREYQKAVTEIERLKRLLKKDAPLPPTNQGTRSPVEYVTSRDRFIAGVERIREYIRAGDAFQVVFSQRLKSKSGADPFSIYRSLRILNPSPYMYYLNLDTFQIVGASPEMLVRVEDGYVETRPIAGTRRRGDSEEDDRRLEAELLADEKERAEHLMLVDLGRNDIGRISEFGSVSVPVFMSTEKYSHVMHIVSAVRGKLRAGLSPIDALFSCFPAGTLSGAPKIRAMEIIAELEPVKRGIYGGAIGYIDFSGNIDSCIAIRTIVVKDGTAYFQAGAGIVYDSNPGREYEESMEKLGANLEAFSLASAAAASNREAR